MRRLHLAVGFAALTAFVLAAFAAEPWLAGLERPWARPAIYLSLGAVLGHVAAIRSAGKEST